MKRKFSRKIFFLCIIGILPLIFWVAAGSGAASVQTTKQKIWIGTITIEESGYAFLDKDDSRENLTKTKYLNHILKDKVMILASGPGGPLKIHDVRRTFSENYQEKTFVEHDHQLCSDGQIIRPGNSNLYEKTITKTIYRGKNRENPHKRVESKIRLTVAPNSAYQIYASSVALVDTEIEARSEIRWACSGETKTSEQHSKTCSPEEDGSSHITGQGTSHTILSVWNPPAEKPLVGSGSGFIENDTIKGTKVIYDQQPTSPKGMASKCVAEWNFRLIEKKSPCPAYIQEVKGDVKINGNAVEEGAYPHDLRGAEISVGPKGRMEIHLGETILFLRPGTQLHLDDPCAQRASGIEFDAKLMKGKIYALISRWTGKGSEFNVKVSNAVNGRGIPAPIAAAEEKILLASLTVPPSVLSHMPGQEEERTRTPDIDREVFENAVFAFLIENIPDKPLTIKAIKGEIEIVAPTEETTILNEGDIFTKDWKRAARPSEVKEILVRGKYSPSD